MSPMHPPWKFLESLREKKVVQYGLTYLAGAWLTLQVASLVGDQFGWSATILRAIIVILATGFPVTLVLAWYHGEQGRQRASGPELLMLTSLLVIAGVALHVVSDGPAEGGTGDHELVDVTSAPAPDADLASVAVLPFENLTGDPEQVYFSDGMTEEIITRLARLDGLKVISRTSTMRYRDADRSLRQIGDELGVAHVLEGSVRREGDRVRVTAQLIDAETDAHLWTDSYDRELESVFEIQADVARAIAGELELRLGGLPEPGAGGVTRYGTDDSEALDLYFRARTLWNRRTEEQLREAIRLFEEAVALDPDFAAAHAGLADALLVLPAYVPVPDGTLDQQESYARALGVAERALELDPDLAEAHATRGMAAAYLYRWETAGEAFQLALEGVPQYATAHQWYALYLAAIGHLDEAVRHADRARVLDPHAFAVALDRAVVHYMARRFDEALQALDQLTTLYPDYWAGQDLQVAILEDQGRFEEAVEALEAFLPGAVGPETAERLASRVRDGYREDGVEGYFDAMVDITSADWAPVTFRASYAFQTGDADAAFQLLEDAASEHEFPMIHVGVSPEMDPLRSDPRYEDLLERMGLARYVR